MAIDISFEEKEKYLLAHFSGEFDPDHIIPGLENIKAKMVEEKYKCCLIDGTNVTAPLSGFDAYLVGKAVADLLPSPFKIAILHFEEYKNKSGQNAAVRRGANAFIFKDKDEALQWLLDST